MTMIKLVMIIVVSIYITLLKTNIINNEKVEDGSTVNLLRDNQKDNANSTALNITAILSNNNAPTSMHGNESDQSNDHTDNIPATLGYYNLSCPFEWYKFSCAAIQNNKFDEQVTAASLQYYHQHRAEIWKAFDSVLNANETHPPPQPKCIFLTGDSLLRQVFISIACHAHSLNAVEHSEIQWRKKSPCPGGYTKCAITGGQNSGFDAASVRFTNRMELHYVPHEGIANNDWSNAEPKVLERMKRQIASKGQIDFGQKTAFPPSGPLDVLVYNLGAHASPTESREMLTSFASDIAMPLMKSEEGPKIVYVTTPTAHFNTIDGQWQDAGMDSKMKQCVNRVSTNPRAELEKQILKAGVNVDVLIDYDDLELGALHVHKGDCLHYCMPGAADLVGARLLLSF